MGIQNYQVYYVVGGVETALTNVVGVNISVGVQQQLQQIRASTATISVRYPTGYASPIAALVSGTEVLIRNLTQTDPYLQLIYRGYISDVTVNYGIPYESGVANADYLTIELEGQYARYGRMQGLDYYMAADTVTVQMDNARIATGVYMDWQGSGTTRAGATTISGTWADWLAKIAQTFNARLREVAFGPTSRGVLLLSPFNADQGTLNFASKPLSTPFNQKQIYDQITFSSIADNYYTQVTVDPETYAIATVTKAGATVPYRTYSVNTLSSSTGAALDYANYLLGNYSTPRLAITSISALAEVQNPNRLDSAVSFGTSLVPAQLPYYPGTQISVEFRGTTYVCVIEGVSMAATPEGARFTFYLSGADLNAYLILDDATRGQLDYNRLGY